MQHLIKVITFIIVFVFCGFIDFHLYNNGAGMALFKALYWYIFTIAFAMALILLKQASIPTDTHRSYLIWLWLYMCYIILAFLYSSQSGVALQALIQRTEMTLLLFSFLIIFLQKGSLVIVQSALMLVVLFSVPMNIIDYLNPTWSTVPGRAAGLFGNPTITGKVLALCMVASISLIPRKLRLIYCFYAGIGILLTFSRAAWMLWALGIAGLAITGYITFKYKKSGLALLTLVGIVTLYSLFSGTLLELLKNTSFANYLTPDTLARLGAGGSSFQDHSASERSYIAGAAWEYFKSHPLTGMGLAYTQEWKEAPVEPHNMFLSMAAEGGIFGAGVYIGLLIMLWLITNPLGKVLVLLLTLSSIFTHNNLTQPAILVFFAFIAAIGPNKTDKEKE